MICEQICPWRTRFSETILQQESYLTKIRRLDAHKLNLDLPCDGLFEFLHNPQCSRARTRWTDRLIGSNSAKVRIRMDVVGVSSCPSYKTSRQISRLQIHARKGSNASDGTELACYLMRDFIRLVRSFCNVLVLLNKNARLLRPRAAAVHSIKTHATLCACPRRLCYIIVSII